MTKILSKPGTVGNFFKMVKSIYKIPTGSIRLGGENLNYFLDPLLLRETFPDSRLGQMPVPSGPPPPAKQ